MIRCVAQLLHASNRVERVATGTRERIGLRAVQFGERLRQAGAVVAEGEVVKRLQNRRGGRPTQTLGNGFAQGNGGERAAACLVLGAKESPQPAPARDPAVLHQILRFEMGTRVVLRPGGVNDRQRAVLIGRLECFQQAGSIRKSRRAEHRLASRWRCGGAHGNSRRRRAARPGSGHPRRRAEIPRPTSVADRRCRSNPS